MGRTVRLLYCCIFFITPLLLAVSYKNVANIVALLLLLITCISWKELIFQSRERLVFISFFTFIAYAFISASWAYLPSHSLERIVKVCLLLGPGIFLIANRHVRQHIVVDKMLLLTGLALFIAVFLSVWQLTGNFLLKEMIAETGGRLNKAADLTPIVACMTVMIWPLLLLIRSMNWHLRYKKTAFALVAICLILLLIIGDSDAAIVAALTGSGAFFWIYIGKTTKLFRWLIMLTVVLFFTLPPILYKQLPTIEASVASDNSITETMFQQSFLHRIEIWDRCVELAKQRPYFGWGMSASRALPKTEQPSKYIVDKKRTDFMYPHNIFIQCWLELGMVGLILLLVWLNSLLNWTEKLSSKDRPFIAAAIMASLTIYAFGNPMWRSWWIVFLLVIAIMFQAACNHKSNDLLANAES